MLCGSTDLLEETLETESAALAVPSHSVDDVHPAENQSSEPGQREQHDGATSQRPTGDVTSIEPHHQHHHHHYLYTCT